MNLSRAETYKFWNEVHKKYVDVDNDGCLYMNGEVFRRGELPRDGYQRLYIETIRKLYKTSPIRQHKHLGYVFKMLPYVNVEFNILCHNPWETNLDMVETLSLDEFCEAANYSAENRNRIIQAYSKITFPVGNTQERFCSFVTDGCNMSTARIFVNPNILYRGHNADKVEILGEFCKLKE